MQIFILTAEIVFGLIIGSFLSVCIYRIPAMRDDLDEDPFPDEPDGADNAKAAEPKPKRERLIQSFNKPHRSICTKCGKQLKWQHNIPVVSWIIQGGRCAFCKERISVRYPTIELLAALMSVLSFQLYGITPTGFALFAFSSMLIVISFIDYDYYIIPNLITYPGILIGLGLSAVNHFTHWFKYPFVPTFQEACWGVLLGGGFLWAFAEIYFLIRKKDGLGMGDVKLLTLIGAIFGIPGSLYTIFLGSIFGSVLGVLLIILARRKWGKPLPFGPYLAFGAVIYIYFGQQIAQWWFRKMGLY